LIVDVLHYVVVVSNGNSGRDGAFTVTDPASAHDVLSVAAMSNSNFLGSLFSLESSSKKKYGPYCTYTFIFPDIIL
jgi:hypothetical protein